MDPGSIAGIVVLSIFGVLFLITCVLSAVKAVQDRKRIKATIAAKQAARIILNKPSARNMLRQTSRSSEEVLSPVGSSGSGLIAERLRRDEQRRQQNESPKRRPFDSVVPENHLDRHQYLERCIRRQLEPDSDFDSKNDMELKYQPEYKRKLHASDPYFDYFSTSSSDKLYVDRRWESEGGRKSRSRSDVDINRQSKETLQRLHSAPYDVRDEGGQSMSNGRHVNDTGVYRCRSADFLSRTTSRHSMRRGSYEAAMENEDFSKSLGFIGRPSSRVSERSVTVYPCYRNGNIGMENRAYVKSDDVLRQVSL